MASSIVPSLRGSGDAPATRASLLARLHQPAVGVAAEQDWRSFIDIYQPLLFAHALRRGLDPIQAEDVAQEILIGISRRLPEFEYQPERCRFRTWLFRVAERKVADHWRRHHRQLPEARPAIEDATGDGQAGAVVDTSTLEPDAAWDERFAEGLLQKARKLAGMRASPMNFRLYLYHVVKGHDVKATVAAFRESQVTPAQVHQAKSRVLTLVEEELKKLWDKYWN